MGSNDPTSGGIKAIETRYAGYRFRSRLEARWAVFFDTLGITWEYEPEGFVVGGTPYLPDFRLNGRTWVEVKGNAADINQSLLCDFTIKADASLLLLGPIPGPGSWSWSQIIGWPSVESANLYRVSFTGAAAGCIVKMEEMPYTSSCSYTIDGNPEEWLKPLPVQPNRERPAYVAARSARFEHGERGR